MTGARRRRPSISDLGRTLHDLKDEPRWVEWVPIKEGDKERKKPLVPGTDDAASVSDPSTWATYDKCDGERRGIVLGSGLGGVDLDGCRDPDTGEVADWAKRIVWMFSSYTEVSPSGTGLKIFAFGAPDEWGAQHVVAMPGEPIRGKAPQIEAYVAERYFTVTWERFADPTVTETLAVAQRAWSDLATYTMAKPGRDGEEAEGDAGDAEARLATLIREVAEAMPGRRNDVLNSNCFEAGGYVGAGYLDREDVERRFREAVDGWYSNRRAPPSDYDKIVDALSAGEKHPLHPRARSDLITEDGAALEFAERHADRLRFDYDAGYWFEWTGSHWSMEKTKLAFSFARDLARELAGGKNPAIRRITSKVAFSANVETFARADRRLAVTSEHWDPDYMLLGTPDGTVDLRSGVLRAASPDEHITKITAVGPASQADCPLWLRFLAETTQGDAETTAFLRRLCGYALTGDTREHMLVFVYGPGGNGKSVFLNTLAGIMGDYARTAAMETFVASHTDRHPADLAMLRGARLVTANETEEGRAWAETRIKQLTGGDKIAARFMRQNFFEYRPTFKLVIVGNHQPSLRNVDEAIRRRFAIVPFLNRPETPDRELEAKLRAEWPGILRWMVDGCREWQEHGLARPDAVRAATDDYFEAQDLLGQWLDECTEKIPVGVTPKFTLAAKLYKSWVEFAVAAGVVQPGVAKVFGQQLQQRGFRRCKGGRGERGYEGIRLRSGGRQL